MIHVTKIALIALGAAYIVACMLWSLIAQIAQRTMTPSLPPWVAAGSLIGLCFGLFLIARDWFKGGL